jgi:hypothetical protein
MCCASSAINIVDVCKPTALRDNASAGDSDATDEITAPSATHAIAIIKVFTATPRVSNPSRKKKKGRKKKKKKKKYFAATHFSTKNWIEIFFRTRLHFRLKTTQNVENHEIDKL